jgi:selenide,water dikinase
MAGRVLVGVATHDDAAVYRLDDRTGLVATIDVFTPIVDDPRTFGRIAAANSLSDVYAMGAQPLFALSFVGWPVSELSMEQLGEVLAGGGQACAEAGIAIIGGHSIDDPEPKFGLTVIGSVDPARVVRNDTGRAGDQLVLTKPIGTGVVASAIKKGVAGVEVAAAAVALMARLNRAAALAMIEVGVAAATDVTGYGLLGHLHEMAHGAGLAARLRAGALPILDGVRALAAAGHVPGGSRRNLDYFGAWTRFADAVDPIERLLCADAQTSGGLLMAVPPDRVDALAAALAARGETGPVIGELIEGEAGSITVDP